MRISQRMLVTSLMLFAVTAYAVDSRQGEVSFNTWVAIPGGLLPAGSYIFVLQDDTGHHHKVAIFDNVSRIHVATVDTVPITRPTPVAMSSQETGVNVSLLEGHGGFQTDAVNAWFRPGTRKGEQFVYAPGELAELAETVTVPPNSEMAEAAIASTEPTAPGTPAGETGQTATVQQNAPVAPPVNQPEAMPAQPGPGVPQQAATADQQQNPQTPAAATTPDQTPDQAAPAAAPETGNENLPKTGSLLPLFGLAGISALGLAATLRALR